MRGMDTALIAGFLGATTLLAAGCSALPLHAAPESAAPDYRAETAAPAVRVDVRTLGALQAALIVHLTTRSPLAEVIVSIDQQGTALSVQPAACRFAPLRPPVVRHASAPPYPLPAIPLCSLVLSAPRGGRYPVTVRVTDGHGRDLVTPIRTTIVMQGESP